MPHQPPTYSSRHAEIVVETVSATCRPGDLVHAIARLPDPALLDSAAFDETDGRFSVLSCRPLDVLTLRNGVLTSDLFGTLADGDNRAIWRALHQAFDWIEPTGVTDISYSPGWIGYLGYELGRHIEHLPHSVLHDTPLPDLRLAFYDAVAVYDAIQKQWTIHRLQFDEPLPGAGDAANALRRLLAETPANQAEPADRRIDQADAAPKPLVNARSPFSPREYEQAVATCVDYIAAGDIFQVNMSHRFKAEWAGDPAALYRTLRRRNPAWYAAFLTFDADGRPCSILSSSPELFLSVRNGRVVTRPIKGTRPRTGMADVDARAASDLLASGKDNAELAMIIDLLRNDLGRVCLYNSVRVTDPCRLETHPTVFHLVGTVEGQLQDGVGQAELLKATFPGGSITGAPKIRAMEIIDELEPTARGVYTGCVGHVGVAGDATWNIAIRTIVCDGRHAYVQAGGGIVADSSPAGEHQETLDKARALLEALAEVPAHTSTRARPRAD